VADEERLQDLIDSLGDSTEFDVTIYDRVTFEHREEDRAVYEKSGEVLAVNLQAVNPEKREALLDEASKQFQEQGEVLREDISEETDAIEADQSDPHVQETLEFFDGIIYERHQSMLEAAVLLQKVAEQGRGFKQRRQQIYNKFGQKGINVNNLCNSGYTHEDGYLRELYYEMEDSESYDARNFRDIFSEIVENTPFTVFVNRDQTAWNVAIEARNKIASQKRYRVEFDFVDIRGIGRRNIETINEAVSELEELIGEFDFEEQTKEYEIRVRIDTNTVTTSFDD